MKQSYQNSYKNIRKIHELLILIKWNEFYHSFYKFFISTFSFYFLYNNSLIHASLSFLSIYFHPTYYERKSIKNSFHFEYQNTYIFLYIHIYILFFETQWQVFYAIVISEKYITDNPMCGLRLTVIFKTFVFIELKYGNLVRWNRL